MISATVGAVVPLVSVFLGALVTYWVNVRARRRSSAEDLVNAAIAAVAIAEANRARSFRVNLPASFDGSDGEDLQRRMLLDAIENHHLRVHEAREALAKVMALDGCIREYYLDTDAVVERPMEIIGVLNEIRDRVSRQKKIRKGAQLGIGG